MEKGGPCGRLEVQPASAEASASPCVKLCRAPEGASARCSDAAVTHRAVDKASVTPHRSRVEEVATILPAAAPCSGSPRTQRSGRLPAGSRVLPRGPVTQRLGMLAMPLRGPPRAPRG